METKISVLLADPGEQYRAAYSKAIGQETDMELVAQTDNGLRAEELITSSPNSSPTSWCSTSCCRIWTACPC